MHNHINQQWRLTSRPVGLIKESDFEWHEEALRFQEMESFLCVSSICLWIPPFGDG